MSSLDVAWVLVHSPLVGPGMWAPVAGELARRGAAVVVPDVEDRGEASGPYWAQHAESAARSIRAAGLERPLVLVSHSGSGVLLPPIRRALGRAPAAYLFVDAGLPEGDRPRLGPDMPREFAGLLESGGRYPNWTDEDLRDEVPDPRLRRQLVDELRPRGLPFWQEVVPTFAGWPDAPSGYLLFSPYYKPDAEKAQRLGWPHRELPGGHFHMLVEPAAVTDALVSLAGECLRSEVGPGG